MTKQQAAQKRRRLIDIVYPELNDKLGYLADDSLSALARNLNTTVQACLTALSRVGGRGAFLTATQKIVQGATKKADGSAYDADFVRRTWWALRFLNRTGKPRLSELLKASRGGAKLYRLLFDERVATLTGRIRGGVKYTQAKNTPFQGLAADGAKLALWGLLSKGYRVVGFVHDEVLVELPDEGGWVSRARCAEVQEIVCAAMRSVLGEVPVEAEYTVATCWSKEAKLIVEGDKVIAWRPE
jgi:hypothetical protein